MKPYLLVMVAICAGAWSVPARADCLARPLPDEAGGKRSVTVAVPSSEIGDYVAKGYVPTACTSVDKAAFRDEICKLQATGNTTVQARIEEVFGMPAARVCNSARLEAGVPITPSPVTSNSP